jgi:hypothetical protein
MNLDGGMGYIVSAIIGSIVMYMLDRLGRHSDHKKEDVDGAHEKADALEKQFLQYKVYVAENYHKKDEQRDFEKAVFAKLDDIMKLMGTKADKEH